MCCLFGILDYGGTLSARERHAIIRSLATAAEERGTDATGLAYFGADGLTIQKAPVRAKKFRFYIPPPAKFIMGHTRMTTQGDERKNRNNHPFEGCAGKVPFALAHNGVIWNDNHLAAKLKLPKTSIETDSYVAVQILEQCGALELQSMANLLKGSFTITVLTQDGLDIVRGNNPFCLWHFPALELYVYASTEDIVKLGLRRHRLLKMKQEKISMRMGDILHIARNGEITRSSFNITNLCEFEYCGRLTPCVRADEYSESVRAVAKWLNVPDDEIELLADIGYDANEIEGLIYDTPRRRRIINEFLHDFELEYEYL